MLRALLRRAYKSLSPPPVPSVESTTETPRYAEIKAFIKRPSVTVRCEDRTGLASAVTLIAGSARHGIAPVTEECPMSKVNEAFEHLVGNARYRIVLATISN